jgi:hypothetical protein
MLKKFDPNCRGTSAIQFVTLVHLTGHGNPFKEIALIPTGAVPLTIPTPLLTVTEAFTLKGAATLASCVCKPVRR